MMEWRRIVENAVRPLPQQFLPLERSFRRVLSTDLYSTVAVPSTQESLRDGYLCYCDDLPRAEVEGLPIVLEVAAGTSSIPALQRGEAHRIFTGGQVRPVEGRLCVLPLERCNEKEGRVFPEGITSSESPLSFLLGVGAEISVGESLVRKGQRLGGGDLARLAIAGKMELPVVVLPKIAICCTGAELVAPGEILPPGRKYSVNDLILADSLYSLGAELCCCRAGDNLEEMNAFFQGASGYDLLLTTGGMGPGKFDLVRRAFIDAGGEVLLDSLSMRPGHSILFGRLGNTPVIGLPGPPRAVETLLYELVLPVVRLLSGESTVWPKRVAARLLTDTINSAPYLRVKPGVLSWKEGNCLVTAAENGGHVDCHILYQANSLAKKGDLVDIHLISGSVGRRNWYGRRG